MRRISANIQSLLLLSLVFCGVSLSPAQEPKGADEQDSAPLDVFRIKNPFFDKPVWRLWALSQEPVEYASPVSYAKRNEVKKQQFAPPKPEDRKYPDFDQRGTGPAQLPELRRFETPPADAAGFWDDCYATMDFAHSNIRHHISDGEDRFGLKGQFIRINYGIAYSPAARAQMGVNFTSQSFARRGRHIVDDYAANHETEKTFFFINCVRATPSHASFNDNDPEAVHDDYDALFGHSYQSVGQSSSEVYALSKMLAAGGCMPRKTKNLLKLHGAYASALLTLFKANLPYVDEDGRAVPYENELRHRPAYSSHGRVSHWHYARANGVYHGYRDGLHLGGMVDMAHGLDAAPPVAVLKLVDLSVEVDGKPIVSHQPRDERLKSVNKTLIRAWGREGETLKLRIDMRDSYDLQDQELSYSCQRVYPNQKNVVIKEFSDGVYEIACTHDPKLPKGRIPVVLVARNSRDVPSNPVFVNFYWPEENERSNWLHYRRRGDKRKTVKKTVTRNKRPVLSVDLDHDVLWVEPGGLATFDYHARDPEGCDVSFYRWAGDVGRIEDGTFTWEVPDDAARRAHGVHLIASDGTGGFTGRRVKVVVGQAPRNLPEGWSATALGYPERIGTVEFSDAALELSCVASGLGRRRDEGLLAFTAARGDFDIAAKIESVAGPDAQVGLSLREGFASRGRYASLYIEADKPARPIMSGKPRFSPWGSMHERPDEDLPGAVTWLRMIRRGNRTVGLASADGENWVQSGSLTLEQMGPTFIGPVVSGGKDDQPAVAKVQFKDAGNPVVPLLAVSSEGKRRRDGSYPKAAKVTLEAPGAETVLYTLDGSKPGDDAEVYEAPVTLVAGTHTVTARAKGSPAVVRMTVTVKAE